MIWIISTIALYLIISAAALFLICSGEKKDAYYDIRNIGVAIGWPLVLLWSGVKKAAHFISKKTKLQAEEAKENV